MAEVDIDHTYAECLIEVVKKFPLLYVTTLEDYKIRTKKDKVWREEVLMTLTYMGFKITGIEEVKKKWKSLRDRYRRIKNEMKIKHSGDGVDDVRTTKWPYFESLMFLDTCSKKQETVSNLQSAPEIAPINHDHDESYESQIVYIESHDVEMTGATPSSEVIVEIDDECPSQIPTPDHEYLPLFGNDKPPVHQAGSTANNTGAILRKRRNTTKAEHPEHTSREMILQSLQSSNEAIAKVLQGNDDSETPKEMMFGQFVGKFLLSLDTEEGKKRKMMDIMCLLVD